MRRTYRAALAALLLLLGSVVEAQHPRCRTKGCRPSTTASTGSLTYMGSLEIRNALMYGGFFHVVTVDSGGAGDYTDISDALAYVASQSPTVESRWVVMVYPGNTDFGTGGFSYAETSLIVPPYTSLIGTVDAFAGALLISGQPWIQLTGTSGTLLSLSDGATLSSLGFMALANPSAALSVMKVSAGFVTVQNVAIVSAGSNAFATNVVEVSGGQLEANGLHTQRANVSTLARNIKVTGGALILRESYTVPWHENQPAAIQVGTGGAVRIFGGRVSAGATVDVVNDAGGFLSIDGLAYSTESGTITRAGVLSARHTHGTSLPAACSVPETFTDTTSGAVRECVCSASNTWVCNARAQASASAPYSCDAGHAGAVYVDTTTPSLCFCTGSAWTTTVALGDCT